MRVPFQPGTVASAMKFVFMEPAACDAWLRIISHGSATQLLEQFFVALVQTLLTILLVAPFEMIMQCALSASQDQYNLHCLCEDRLATDGLVRVDLLSTSKVDLLAALWSIAAMKRVAQKTLVKLTEQRSASRLGAQRVQADRFMNADPSENDEEFVRACTALTDARKCTKRLQKQLQRLEQQKYDAFNAIGLVTPSFPARGNTSGSTQGLVSRTPSYRNLPGDLSVTSQISKEDWTKVVLASLPCEIVMLRSQQLDMQARVNGQLFLRRAAAAVLVSQNNARSAEDERGRVVPPTERALGIGAMAKLCTVVVAFYLM